MSNKLKDKQAKIEIGGTERLVQLFVMRPHPADEFVPKKDKLLLVLKFSITKEEKSHSYPIRYLREMLEPQISRNRKQCSVTRRLRVENGLHKLVIEYHVYDSDYGVSLYHELRSKLF